MSTDSRHVLVVIADPDDPQITVTQRVLEGMRHIGKCGNEREPDGSGCTEQLYAGHGDVQVQCPKCGAWQGVNAPVTPPNCEADPDDKG